SLPSGEVISLQPGPASNGLVIAGPTFPHWLTPSQECSFHLDRQALHDILSERHYEGVTPVVALFVDMSGKPYHSSPFDFDCALPCQWRMTEAQMRERMALEDKLHRASERV
ncbi:MAG: hypothetical protein JWQ02_478, partial [Capsulimonas sp.]|nr:hypothetical protein [Capsulimonas sp.]